MSSFYPSFGGGGSIDPSTIDYNKIKDIPVVNLEGTEEVPSVLSDLDCGQYNLKGYYKLDAEQETLLTENPLDLYVTEDVQSGKKVFTYVIIRDGMPHMIIGTFDEEGSIETLEEIPLMQSSWGAF